MSYICRHFIPEKVAFQIVGKGDTTHFGVQKTLAIHMKNIQKDGIQAAFVRQSSSCIP